MAQRREILPLLQQFITNHGAQAFQGEEAWRIQDVLLFSQVSKHGDELITSRSHGRSRSRISYYVLVQMGASEQLARVEYFLNVLAAPDSNVAPLRLAVCTLYQPRARSGELYVAHKERT